MRNLTRRRFSTGLLAVLAAGCGGRLEDERTETTTPAGRPPTPGGDPPPVFGSEPTPEPSVAFGPVSRSTPPPAVVWSWTTSEQAAEVRSGRVLFTRATSPTLGRGFLFDVLQRRADAGDSTAARLVGPELLEGRFGWHNPWSTVRGAAADESYGLELLAITMKPDTLYARVLASTAEISFVDSAGAQVPVADALAAYGRVGGILFENDVPVAGKCGTGSASTGQGGGGNAYREIYLGNEAQIASFSHRTPAILDRLEASIAELQILRAWLAGSGALPARTYHDWECRMLGLWQFGLSEAVVDRYLASLAFSSPQYLPSPENVDLLIAELVKARFVPDPFAVTA
ncbi:MAG: hypothetical protein JWP97_4049 [Labilithrix sp.]|nr:hypothetical protein [Labilithrix sp.]